MTLFPEWFGFWYSHRYRKKFPFSIKPWRNTQEWISTTVVVHDGQEKASGCHLCCSIHIGNRHLIKWQYLCTPMAFSVFIWQTACVWPEAGNGLFAARLFHAMLPLLWHQWLECWCKKGDLITIMDGTLLDAALVATWPILQQTHCRTLLHGTVVLDGFCCDPFVAQPSLSLWQVQTMLNCMRAPRSSGIGFMVQCRRVRGMTCWWYIWFAIRR